jgi:hypothetical protein
MQHTSILLKGYFFLRLKLCFVIFLKKTFYLKLLFFVFYRFNMQISKIILKKYYFHVFLNKSYHTSIHFLIHKHTHNNYTYLQFISYTQNYPKLAYHILDKV